MTNQIASSYSIQDLKDSINEEKDYHLAQLIEYTQYIERLAHETGDKKLHDIHCHLLNLQSIEAAECQIAGFLINADRHLALMNGDRNPTKE
tara:strand:+ start:178 stop:453 length:276 start_codon:yes stop_codon:yes gene_type:complete